MPRCEQERMACLLLLAAGDGPELILKQFTETAS